MKPMLAANANLDNLRFPYYASPKLDGVRCLIHNGVVLSRNLKPIRNEYVQRVLGDSRFNGFDGELIVGSPTAEDVFRQTSAAVSTIKGEPEFRFHVFDDLTHYSAPFNARLNGLRPRIPHQSVISLVDQRLIVLLSELDTLEEEYLEEGYEGLMLRDPKSKYKFGRSTVKENILLKVKRFSDSEARVLGFEEQMRNNNKAEVSELGRTKRSSHQAGLVPADTLGALVVQDVNTGIEFNIGTGMSAEERKHIWDNWRDYHGKFVSYKFFPVGVKDKPRHPVFKGFRELETVTL